MSRYWPKCLSSIGSALLWCGRPGCTGRSGLCTTAGTKANSPAKHRSGVRLAIEQLEPRNLLSVATINWASVNQTIAGFGALMLGPRRV